MINSFINWWNRGPDAIPDDLSVNHRLYSVVYRAWSGGFTVASDTARSNAAHVAIAASLDLITTREADGSFGRVWYITQAGIGFLQQYWRERQ